MNPNLLEYICCPACKSDLAHREGEPHTLVCRGCGLMYTITDNIPQLDVDAAQRPPEETRAS